MHNKLSKVVSKKPASKQKPVPVKIVNDAPSPPSSYSTKEDSRWRAESALRTLAEAEKIRRDRSLMKEVKSVAKEQMKQLNNVCKK